mmetsp:Transcript_530/g.996  ORF Transcript_530/g.996 Transcript_530/m.996 type:complete len:202 (+) Transcript_530:1910-2515(+)
MSTLYRCPNLSFCFRIIASLALPVSWKKASSPVWCGKSSIMLSYTSSGMQNLVMIWYLIPSSSSLSVGGVLTSWVFSSCSTSVSLSVVISLSTSSYRDHGRAVLDTSVLVRGSTPIFWSPTLTWSGKAGSGSNSASSSNQPMACLGWLSNASRAEASTSAWFSMIFAWLASSSPRSSPPSFSSFAVKKRRSLSVSNLTPFS